MYKIPKFYMIFAQKMPEFYIIIARKIFPQILGGARAPLPPAPPPISYTYAPQGQWEICPGTRKTTGAKMDFCPSVKFQFFQSISYNLNTISNLI